MVIIVISLLSLAALIFITRLTAIYSSELFSSSEKILSSFGRLTERQRRFIEEIDRHPHDLLLTAGLFKSFSLIVGTVLAVFTAANLHATGGWLWAVTAVIAAGGFWLIFTLVVDIMPPTGGSESLQTRALAHLGLVAFIYHAFSPLRQLAGASRARYAEERRDEEKKEEIVERAIETLAESIGTEEPIIEEDERQMIQQIFRLDTTEVKEVMVPRINIVAVQPGITLNDLRQVVREEGHSRIPVYDGDLDTILGIVYAKDIFCRELPEHGGFDLRTFIRPPLLVPETQKIDKLLEEFRRKKMHLAIVVDEYGGTAGLVSLEDIIEEIVGEIEDEHDHARPAIVSLPDRAIMVSGLVPLDEITEHFDLKPFSEEFETVGGLIYDMVGGVPQTGRVLVKPPLRFTVVKVDGQRIEAVRIEKLTARNDS